MNMTRDIYIDFDDVLCETALAFTELVREHFGKTTRFENIASFNLDVAFGLTPGQLEELMQRGHEPDVLARLEPVKGAVEGLRRWSERGYRISIVTGRPATTEEVSKRWLDAYSVPYAEVVFVDKYNRKFVSAGHFSAPMISLAELTRRPFCLAVEDAPHMAAFLAREMTMPVAVLQRPWNADDPDLRALPGNRISHCRDWNDILERFPRP